MKRLHVFQLAFNTMELIRDSLELFDEQLPDYPIASKTLVDCRWPDCDDMLKFSQDLQWLAHKHEWNYVKPVRNYGMAGNYNWLMRELFLGEEDVIFCLDPDARPQESKYLDAMMDVFNTDRSVFTVQLNRPCVYKMNIPKTERIIGNTTVLDYKQLVAWSVGGFDVGWVIKANGMQEGTKNYGWTEHCMVRALGPMGGTWVILRDFYDVHLPSPSQNYIDWKLATVNQTTKLDFESYLKEKK